MMTMNCRADVTPYRRRYVLLNRNILSELSFLRRKLRIRANEALVHHIDAHASWNHSGLP